MKLTILIVDDSPINLMLVCTLLEHEGHTVLRAHDAPSAQAILQQTTPEMILMDIQMPGMDGLALTRLLRGDSTYQDTCIVALTAHAMVGDAEKGLAAGCDAYITKPFETRTLNAQLMQIYQQSPARCSSAP